MDDIDPSDLSLAQLLSRLHLSSDAVHTVYEEMQAEHIGFAEAALRLGLVTQGQIDEALAHARQSQGVPEPPSLIESALRRGSGRDVVIVQGEEVEPGPRLQLAHDPDSERSEKIRALRTELLLLSDASINANSIALLSACASEGRSQLAAELAISFSQLGRRALLVDADMRNPSQHKLFGSANRSGLSEAISTNQKPIFHRVRGLPQLSLLTSGSIPSNPLELLSDGRFERLLTDWRRTFEFVILDTPPVQSFADGIAAATLARRVLVVSRAQHTSFNDTRALLRRLATTQSQILGAVINHF
jgi:receptor protein-tyrosine kinase